MRVPGSQENFSGKGLNEQPEENWVPAMSQSGHEGEEQAVVGQEVYTSIVHTVFRRESADECQKGVKWLKRVPSSQESVE